jgi:hypothetical protein
VEEVSISHIQMKRLSVGQRDAHAALRNHDPAHAECTGVPRWAVVTAATAPALLVVGFLVAAILQPVSYDPLRDTISALAARGAADPWVMTAAIAAVGVCYLATALGLSPVRRAGRLALAGGGVATLSIAAFPTPLHGYSGPHAVAVIAASTTMCAWSVLAAHRQHRARLLTFGPNVAASALTFGLIMWFTLEINGGDLGLAERCAAVAPALWLFPVAFGLGLGLAELSFPLNRSSVMVWLTLPTLPRMQTGSWTSSVVTSHAARQRRESFAAPLTLPAPSFGARTLGSGRKGAEFGSATGRSARPIRPGGRLPLGWVPG